jgi:hypothetical protein
MFAQKEFACPMNIVRGYCFRSAGSRSMPVLNVPTLAGSEYSWKCSYTGNPTSAASS